jgi:HrpA-like RNA helicase
MKSERLLGRPDLDLKAPLGVGITTAEKSRSLHCRQPRARGLPSRTLRWPLTLDAWLPPWLDGITRRDHLARLSLTDILRSLLPWEKQRQLDELAPTHLRVRSGSNIRIDYLDESAPAVSVRLQEVFGLDSNPKLGGGRVPITFKLLSPARRPHLLARLLRRCPQRHARAIPQALLAHLRRTQQ